MTLTVRAASVTGAVTASRALTHAEMDANWAHVIQASNQSYTPSGSGASARTVQTVLREMAVSVKDFGALGDNSTDDSTAFSNWTSYIVSNGRTGFIPKGIYRVSAWTANAANGALRVIGEGKDQSIVKITGAGRGLAITGANPPAIPHYLADFTVKHVNGDTSTKGGTDGIYFTSQLHAERVGAKWFAGDGFRPDSIDANTETPYFSKLVMCQADDNGDDGFFLDTLVNGTLLDQCEARRNTGSGLHITAANTTTIIGGHYSYNAEGIHLDGGAALVNGFGYYSEGNTNKQLIIESGVNQVFLVPGDVVGDVTISSTDRVMYLDYETGNFSTFEALFTKKVVISDDAILVREDTNALAQRNGTTAGKLRVYNTFTDASNYLRFALDTAGGNLVVAGESAGTGGNAPMYVYNRTSHNLILGTANTDAVTIDSAQAVSAVKAITAHSGTAIPAGGTAGAGLKVSSTANFGVFFGSGEPTLSAAKGSLYLRSDGSSSSTRMYVNTDGSTAWTAVTTAT